MKLQTAKRAALIAIFKDEPYACKGVRVVAGKVQRGNIGFWKHREEIPDIVNPEAPSMRGQQIVMGWGLDVVYKKCPEGTHLLVFRKCRALADAARSDAQDLRGTNDSATPEQMADYALRNEARLTGYVNRAVREWVAELTSDTVIRKWQRIERELAKATHAR
jgi:hypothetical protein